MAEAMDVEACFRCYYCPFESTRSSQVLRHELLSHSEFNNPLSIRQRCLDAESGHKVWQSVHFGISLNEIHNTYKETEYVVIDMDTKTIRFKRPLQEAKNFEFTNDDQCVINEDCPTDEELLRTVKTTYEVIKEQGRGRDFLSVMKAISGGTLSATNITLQLLLDIGSFLSVDRVSNVRYNPITMNFWSTVYKLFKGKALRFFRGFMAGASLKDDGQQVSFTDECQFNMVVPSAKSIRKHTEKYKLETLKPGIIKTSFESFAEHHTVPQYVKLSIDGKKLSYGIGKLGEEDLCGHERKPTLLERQNRLQKEIDVVDSIYRQLDLESPGIKRLNKQDVLKVISILSHRIKELRELMVIKKRTLENMKLKIEGDWKSSKFAPSMSYLQSKIIQCTATVHTLLECVDDFGYIAATLNETYMHYIRGIGTKVHMKQQMNYECLKKFTDEVYMNLGTEQSSIIKQHSSRWFELRKEALVTGSTWFGAIGLSTLSDQKKFFAKKFEDKEEIISPEIQKMFDYGTENEINGRATIVAKVLPVYYPSLIFREDGCETFQLSENSCWHGISSGDGAGIEPSSGASEIVFEIKCPIPGKTHTTDVHYSLPSRYGLQLLAEMHTRQCQKYGYLSYTPDSSSFLCGEMNGDTLQASKNLTEKLYLSGDTPRKPTRRHPDTPALRCKINEFVSESRFIAEFPSLLAVDCDCSQEVHSDTSIPFMSHQACPTKNIPATTEFVAVTCIRTKEKLNEAYAIMQKPAKEVLLTVMSDLNRTQGDYAVPVAYHFAGYSLDMNSVRCILRDVIMECKSNELLVKVLAFDGQFLEIAIEDDNGRPLTLCRLQKQVWKEVKMLKKNELLKHLLAFTNEKLHQTNIETVTDLDEYFTYTRTETCGFVIGVKGVRQMRNLSIQNDLALYTGKAKMEEEKSDNQNCTDSDPINVILQYLPDEIVQSLGGEGLELIRSAAVTVVDVQEASHEPEPEHEPEIDPVDGNQNRIDTATYKEKESILKCLKEHNPKKYGEMSVGCMDDMMQSAISINKNFTVIELKKIANIMGERPAINRPLKTHYVALISAKLGDGTCLEQSRERARQSPLPKLKVLCRRYISKLRMIQLQIMYANIIMPDRIKEWNNSSFFKPGTLIEIDGSEKYIINQWYAQPAVYGDQLIQPIIDPHHILVNNRAKVCAHGLPAQGISSNAWVKVAKDQRNNRTGLSLELVVELRDRQRNAYAKTTFSEAVEDVMITNGDEAAAKWCHLIRGWYEAVDEAGLPMDQRLARLFDMREYLLSLYLPKINHFPPPGAYVASLSIAQFEGLLSNIDRRIQLYHWTTYNQRSVSSLDSETYFSTFQDVDPKGTGILQADDVPTALATSTFLTDQRLNSNRGFMFTTASKTPVYKLPPYEVDSQASSTITAENSVNTPNAINIRNHKFDFPERRKKKPCRKLGTINHPSKPGRGAVGVRYHHKINEEFILYHRRMGYSDEEIDSLLTVH